MDREELKKEVIKFYKRYKSRGKIYTVRHFLKKGESESSIRYIIKQAERNPTTTTVRTPFANVSNSPQTSGRVVKKTATPKPSQALTLALEGYSNKGEKMLETCQDRCSELLTKFKDHDWILDNKAGFSFINNQGSSNRGGWVFAGMAPPPPRNRNLFIPKLDVWVAFSNKGVSEPFIQSCDSKFDYQVYLEECIKKRLIPFINQNHPELENTVVWSDGVTPFINKKVTSHLDSENIKYVVKEDNPGNRVKCFSYFWNLLRNYVYDNDWEAQNEKQLEDRIRKCLKKMDMETLTRLANDTQHRIEEMASNGEIKEWSDNKKKYTDLFSIKYRNSNNK